MSHHHYTPVDELRSATRFVKERHMDFAIIWSIDCPATLVEVHDESLGGLGVYLGEAICHVGDEVEVVYAHELYHARVCHIQPQENGERIAGLDCTEIAQLMLESM